MEGRILGRKLARELPLNELDAVAGAATITSSPNNVGPGGGDTTDGDDTGGPGSEH